MVILEMVIQNYTFRTEKGCLPIELIEYMNIGSLGFDRIVLTLQSSKT
jgi:hypothetical protein